MTTELTNSNFDSEVLKSDIPVLVDFWAPWCGPCRMMAPILDELSDELKGKLKVSKLNTEIPEHYDVVMKFQIQSIPNMKLFKNGQVVHEFVGFRPKEIFLQELNQII